MEIKLRCSQTQFKALATQCWDAEHGSWGGAWRVPLTTRGALLPSRLLQNKRWTLILLFVFFNKNESTLWISFNLWKRAPRGKEPLPLFSQVGCSFSLWLHPAAAQEPQEICCGRTVTPALVRRADGFYISDNFRDCSRRRRNQLHWA